MTEAFTVPLNTRNNDLEVVGGKGRSLSRLANAGYAAKLIDYLVIF